MRVFFGTLRILISQLLRDTGMFFHDLFWVLWDNRYGVFKWLATAAVLVAILLVEIWYFIKFYHWADDLYKATLFFGSAVLLVSVQSYAWFSRKDIHRWFLNEWERASHTYEFRRRENERII